jgi:hypothetical protein
MDIKEAITVINQMQVDGVVERYAAITLQTGRAKDKARLLQFVEAGGVLRTPPRSRRAGRRALPVHLRPAWTGCGLAKI